MTFASIIHKKGEAQGLNRKHKILGKLNFFFLLNHFGM